MKKIVHYFLIVIVIIFVTSLVVSVFNARLVYQGVKTANRSDLPYFLVRIIDHFNPPVSPVPVLKAENTIRILEGWTNNDIAKYLASQENFTSHDFLDVVGSAQVKNNYSRNSSSSQELIKSFPFLKNLSSQAGLEGYLFPDTYQIYASSSPREVAVKMLNNFNEKITAKMRADIKKQGRTLNQIIIMASIVAKEAPINYSQNDNHQARIIAGIFWKRLKRGQALQSDATLSYVLNDNITSHKARDLETNSLYNTYKYRGLPPGPISNPGLLAIKAAIYPLKSKYNYFLTPKNKKVVIYAQTYSEHLRNVYKYLR